MADNRKESRKNRRQKDSSPDGEKKRTNGVIRNLIYIFAPIVRERPEYLFHMGFEAVLYVLLPLLGAAASALAVSMLGDGTAFPVMAAAVFAVFGIYGLTGWLHTYYHMINVSAGMDIRISYHQRNVNAKFSEVSMEVYEDEAMWELAEKSNQALWNNNVGLGGMVSCFQTLCANILGLTVYILILGSVNLKIVVMLVGLSLINAAVVAASKRVYEKSRHKLAKNLQIQRYLDEVVDHVQGGKDIRVFGLSGWLIGKYDRAIKENRKYLRKYHTVCFLSDMTEVTMAAVRDLICCLYLISLLQKGMAVGEFVFYLGVISGFAAWISEIGRSIMEIHRDSLQTDDVRAFLELDNQEREGTRTPKNNFSEIEIRLEHVSYRYPNAEEPVLKDVSFTLHQGEHLALVGVNGAGKSTLVKLILGLYLPTEGSVYVNGIDTREINAHEYFRQIAAIFQDQIIMSYSVAENVALSEVWDEDRVWEILEKAGLEEKIRSLPKGLLTCLGKDIEEDGIYLSGGEIQKLLLARALYRRPKLMMLDEPTAALDAIAEQRIYEIYRDTLGGAGSIFISHRLASTRFCDQILLLEDGRIKECGTHEELMELGGSYAKLFQIQSKYYQKGEEADGTDA
nr:ABC transporter ATP-binding protein [uncultured Faecalimonas sp.]